MGIKDFSGFFFFGGGEALGLELRAHTCQAGHSTP
jgi:hypothetical protein